MDDVTCMTCLVRRAGGLPTQGTHVDRSGIVHATVRRARQVVLACTLTYEDHNGHREWYVDNETVRI